MKLNNGCHLYDENITVEMENWYIQTFKDIIVDEFDKKLCKNFGKLFSIKASNESIEIGEYILLPCTFVSNAKNPNMAEVVGRIVSETIDFLRAETEKRGCVLDISDIPDAEMKYYIVKR